MVTVVLQARFNAHYEAVNAYISEVVNMSITGLIILALIWSLSVLIDKSEASLEAEKKKSDDLLHNILPANIVKDLKKSGTTIPKRHENVTILFTDFEGFTRWLAPFHQLPYSKNSMIFLVILMILWSKPALKKLKP